MAKIRLEIPDFEDHERFLKNIRVNGDCWDWVGNFFSKYGAFYVHGYNFVAHRVSYKIFVKNPSLDKAIDHICKNKKCVNPEHLREISDYLNNTLYSNSPIALNSKMTHCKNGHLLSGDNIWTSSNRRTCKICKKDYRKNLKLNKG